MELLELKNSIQGYGIIGAGGAGFPSHEKLSNKIDTIILNCAECEPLFKVDRQLLKNYTDDILSTFDCLVKETGAKKGIVALKKSYAATIDAVKAIIHRYNRLEVFILGDVYPIGDEVILIYETLKRVVPEGGIPLNVGAMVFNVETVYNMYRGLFLEEPVTEKYVTVAGAVRNPITLRVPLGIRIDELVKLAGGATVSEYEILNGGPMTGRLTEGNSPVTKTTKGIIVLPKEHSIIQKRHEKGSYNLNRIKSICSQCQMCTDLCPRNLLGHNIKPHKIMRALGDEVAVDYETYKASLYCCECGLCEVYACHQSLGPRTVIAGLKAKLRENGIKGTTPKPFYEVDVLREGRLVPSKRLIARLGLKEYDLDAPLVEKYIPARSVEIKLGAHIGVPAVPLVKVGDKVKKGELIGETPAFKLGTKVHASIDGTVIKVDQQSIIIEH